MGDELALRNDLSYLDAPALADDNRWMHRPVMDWAAARVWASSGSPSSVAEFGPGGGTVTGRGQPGGCWVSAGKVL